MLPSFTAKHALEKIEAQELSFGNELFSRLNIHSLVSLWNIPIPIRWTLLRRTFKRERVPRHRLVKYTLFSKC